MKLNLKDSQTLVNDCINIARKAGDAIMQIYDSGDFEFEVKNEGGFISPLTKADKVANKIIVAGLKELSDYPIISEEGSHDAGDADTLWLVDPIEDGTKEFLKRNGEFTVNIGLIRDSKPVLGVVYAPLMYFGTIEAGAYKQENGKEAARISAEFKGTIPIIVASRSHLNEETEAFLAKLGEHKVVSMGSSLKLCLVAEGTAAMYPRFAPTSL